MKNNGIISPQQLQQETAEIARRLFRAPSPSVIIVPIIVVGLLAGSILRGFSTDALKIGFGVFVIPAFLAAYATKPVAELLGGKFYLRRSFLLVFISEAIIFATLGIWELLALLLSWQEREITIVIFSCTAIVWFRLLVLCGVSNSDILKSLPAASLQSFFGYLGIAATYPFGRVEMLEALLFYIIFLFAAAVLIEMANLPFKSSFGMDGLRMLRHMLDHITEKGQEGVREMEQFFESISIPIVAHIGAVSFRSKDSIKALVIVPSVHPGPFGYMGGSDLPAKLARDLKDVTKNVLVPHGPSTHDFNPPSSSETKKISSKVRTLLYQMDYSRSASPLLRHRQGSANVCAQLFGDSVLLVGSLAPKPTDDLDFPTGYAATKGAKTGKTREALFIDAHNCMEEGSGLVLFGSTESRDVIEACGEVASRASHEVTDGVRMGYASDDDFSIERDGIGSRGIQVMVIEVAGQKFAYLLYDGNNMVPGLREDILSQVRGIVEEACVLTTDNHSVNVTLGGYNPVGGKGNEGELIERTKVLVHKAVEDLEDVDVAMKAGTIEGFRIFGHQSAARISTVVNSTIATLKINAVVSLLLALSLSAIVFLHFS